MLFVCYAKTAHWGRRSLGAAEFLSCENVGPTLTPPPPPTWRTRVFLCLCYLSLTLSGTGDRTSRQVATGIWLLRTT